MLSLTRDQNTLFLSSLVASIEVKRMKKMELSMSWKKSKKIYKENTTK